MPRLRAILPLCLPLCLPLGLSLGLACGSGEDGASAGKGGGGAGASTGGSSVGGGTTTTTTITGDLKEVSQSCAVPGQCVSGYCPDDDGVCCASACDEACMGCLQSVTGKPNGVCAPLLDGADPDGHCPSPYLCGAGVCCGFSPTPEAADTCPAVCTGGCSAGVCTIACVGDQLCKEIPVVCPQGLACRVVCQGFEACRDATITCPQTYDCAVDCSAGDSACRKVLVTCADGPCAISCGPDQNICNDAEVTCGANSCAAECDPSGPGGNKKPNVNCGDACSCQSC